jgi:hypothetical protein
MRRHRTLGTEGRHQMRETDPKKLAHEHKDRQLMDRVAKAARHLVKWIHNEGLIKGEDVHLKTLEEAIRKLDKHRGAGTAATET